MNPYLSFSVNAESGEAFHLDAPNDILARWADDDPPKDSVRLARINEQVEQKVRGLPYGIKAEDFTDAGWGVVFVENEDPRIRAAGMKLLEHRRAQFQDPKKCVRRSKELTYRGEQTAQEWVVSQGGDAGSVDPRQVPYYLLVVGTPDRIPFHFTQDLAVEYCVGRLAFDAPENYSQYVDNLIAWEKERTGLPRRAAFFAPRHDPATDLSSDCLIRPLLDGTGDEPGVCQLAACEPMLLLEDDATREKLQASLADPQHRPSFLFTASHGAQFSCGSAGQIEGQGNLVCQSWPGNGPTQPHQFGPRHVPAQGLKGMVVFSFACHSAGTPRYDAIFRDKTTQSLTELAPAPFIASLAQEMLRNGAVGFIGHVDLALGKSLINSQGQQQPLPFQNLSRKILDGLPLGLALLDIQQRYASKSVELKTLQLARRDSIVSNAKIASTWLARNDAGGYLLLGDPAAQLRLIGTKF